MKHFNRAAAAICLTLVASALLLYFVLTPRLRVESESGAVYLSSPAREGDKFSIEFIHSVNKTPVKDIFRIESGTIHGDSCVYYGFGAGVQTELAPGESLEITDGAMIVSGYSQEYRELRYIVGTVSDHVFCYGSRSPVSLRETCGRNAAIVIRID